MQIRIANIIRGTLIGNTMSVLTRYISRVVNGGGIVESPQCVETALNSNNVLNSASFLLQPSGYKGGTLYSEIPTNGNGDLTWTRGSDAFRTNASGVIQRVPWNLVQYSEQFNNAFHFPFNLNAFGSGSVANTTATVDPNGLNFADYIQENTSASVQHSIIDIFSGNLSGTTYTWSVFAKAAQRTIIQLANNGGGGGQANYNLTTGVASLSSGVSASMQDVGNGWYRCILSYTSNATGNHNVQIRLCDASGNSTYTGNGTSGVYIWGAQLVEGTTAQTYLPTTDRLNFPRLSYMYGSCPSALLEPQRTNSVFPSEDFSTTWAATNTTVTTNQTTAPDGNLTADRISITSNFGFIRRMNLTVLNSTTYTVSVFVKNDTISAGNTFRFYFNNNLGSTNAAEARAVIDINAGSVTSQSVGAGISGVSASITSLANAWYRVQLTFTLGASSGHTGAEIGFDAPTATRTFFAWGAQLEVGAYPTTYIPTTSATATRVADSFSRNNIFTNGLISASGGTWFVELRNNIGYTRDAAAFGLFIDSASGGITNGFSIRQRGTAGDRLSIQKQVAGTQTFLYLTTANTTKIAIKWNGTTADIFENGTKVVSATSFTPTAMEFLNASIADVPFFIQQMALFPTPLSDTDCELLTGTAYSSYESMATALGYYVI